MSVHWLGQDPVHVSRLAALPFRFGYAGGDGYDRNVAVAWQFYQANPSSGF
jgi:hypothetical protein